MTESKTAAKVIASGYMLDAKAFDLISRLPVGVDPDAFVQKLIAQKSASGSRAKMITEVDVASLIPQSQPREETGVVVSEEAEVEVISDPTQSIAPAEGSEGYERLFRDRYERL